MLDSPLTDDMQILIISNIQQRPGVSVLVMHFGR